MIEMTPEPFGASGDFRGVLKTKYQAVKAQAVKAQAVLAVGLRLQSKLIQGQRPVVGAHGLQGFDRIEVCKSGWQS